MRNLRYDIQLDLPEESLGYAGLVRLECDGFPSEVVFDSIGHVIRSVTVDGRLWAIRPDVDRGQFTISGIPEEARSVSVEFEGTVEEGAVSGFYVSPFGDGRLLTTDLEPTGARRFLPCLDRPDAKAVFVLEAVIPSRLSAVSNSPVLSSTDLGGGRRKVRFAPTPPMSTYLLYLGVGPFEERSADSELPSIVAGTAPHRSVEAQFALEQARPLLSYFQEYYGIPYPLPKLHLIAVPHYGSGAMENWGAITFQEYYLLVGDRSPIASRQNLVEVLAHEIAHQWFGNLVTLSGWSDLWLNESFATFVGFKAADRLVPEWNVWETFLLEQTARAMFWDALPHTHPVQVTLRVPEEVHEVFDTISYGKGASVLRMVEAFLGEPVFREGVTRYLHRHQWGNATATDLWSSLSQAAGDGVDRLCSEWIGRAGFPLLDAHLEGETLVLSQSRFSTLRADPSGPWPVPLTVRLDDRLHRQLFDSPRTRIPTGGARRVLVNPGRTAFCRVRYHGPLEEAVFASFSSWPAIDRWGLLNDGRAFLLAGKIPLDGYLRQLSLLERESDPFVLGEGCAAFEDLYPLIHRLPSWETATRRLFTVQAERLGLHSSNGESDRVKAIRAKILVGRTRTDPGFAASLAGEFARLDAVDPDLVEPVLLGYAMGAGPGECATLLDRFRTAPSVERGRQLGSALGCVPSPDCLREALDLLFTDHVTLGAWGEILGSAVQLNPELSETVWGFLDDRLSDLARLLAGTGTMGRMLQNVIPQLGLADPPRMAEWARSHPVPESANGVVNGLDYLDALVALLRRES